MFRRNMYERTANLHQLPTPLKHEEHSISTSESSSPREPPQIAAFKPSIRLNKEKSQLCKKFVENGFCPYRGKCKFAHGSHELRRNHQFNSKYKTKQCGVFIMEGCCQFGDRCNFIHKGIKYEKQSKEFDSGFQEIKAEGRIQSRLLQLLSSTDINQSFL